MIGIPVPVGVLIAIVGNLAVGIVGGRGVRSRVVPAVTGFVWLVVAVVLGSRRPEGDLIVTGQTPGVAFLFLGAIAAAVAIGVGPRRGPWRAALHPSRPRADEDLSRVDD